MHRPHVDLYVEGSFVNSSEFLLEVLFDVVGAAAVVRTGELVAARRRVHDHGTPPA